MLALLRFIGERDRRVERGTSRRASSARSSRQLVDGLSDAGRVCDRVDDIAERAFVSSFWGAHPYGHELLGRAADVKSFTREDLVAFRDSEGRLGLLDDQLPEPARGRQGLRSMGHHAAEHRGDGSFGDICLTFLD